ncbi:MAG: TIGR03016 family PEP-CTERM system-associated outer membrane protein, partial [Gammaproteobacteria bacterium]
TNTNQNGFFYTFGGQWRPSRKFSVSAGWGNNLFVTVFLSPFQRLQWTTTYRNNDIGTNTGSTWQTNLRYNTRRSSWRLTYNEDTTTTQQVFLERQFFLLRDPENPNLFISDPVTNLPIVFFLDIPTLTDEVFVRKRGDLSYSFRTGKSSYNASIFTERRTFQLSQNEDDVYGVSGSWSWRYSPRMSTVLRSSWQNTDSNTLTGPFSSQFFNVTFRVQRNIARNISGNIEYRYQNQTSDNSAFDYDENRISIGLSGRF